MASAPVFTPTDPTGASAPIHLKEARMQLTLRKIQNVIRKDHRIDPQIDTDEPFKAIVYLREGWTWNALDGNRSVEGFILKGNPDEPADTLEYLQYVISNIEPIIEEEI